MQEYFDEEVERGKLVPDRISIAGACTVTASPPPDDYRVPLAEGVREGLKRSPVIVIFILGTLAILWLGTEILQRRAEERATLQERIDELTEQLVHCHEMRNAQLRRGSLSVQSNTSP